MSKAVAGRQRGISIPRVLQFFREGNPDEVRVVLQLALEAAGQRHILINGPQPQPAQPTAATTRRKRRTRAEMAASKEQSRLNGEAPASSLKNWPSTEAASA